MADAPSTATRIDHRHLHQGCQEFSALAEGRRLEQGLLFVGLERADHGEGGHQPLVGRALDGLPVGDDLVLLEIARQRAQEAGAVERRLGLLAEVIEKAVPHRLDPAVAPASLQFPADPEAAEAGKGDQVAAVLHVAEGGDAAGAADGIDHRRVVPAGGIEGLDHADHAVAEQRVLKHGDIARLEDMKRQPPARQQENAGQGKDRQRRGQIMGSGFEWHLGHAINMGRS